MTSDSGRLPEGGDAQQAPCEASQSVIAQTSPEHRSSHSIDEELIEADIAFLRQPGNGPSSPYRKIADRLESLLSDRAKLEERVRELLEAWGDGADDARMAPLVIALNNALNRSTDR